MHGPYYDQDQFKSSQVGRQHILVIYFCFSFCFWFCFCFIGIPLPVHNDDVVVILYSISLACRPNVLLGQSKCLTNSKFD